MNKPYIIIYDSTMDNESKEKLIEAIRSTYASKVSSNNTIIISSPENANSKIIFDKIDLLVDSTTSALVIPLNYFYGRLDSEVWNWLEENFPDRNYSRSK